MAFSLLWIISSCVLFIVGFGEQNLFFVFMQMKKFYINRWWNFTWWSIFPSLHLHFFCVWLLCELQLTKFVAKFICEIIVVVDSRFWCTLYVSWLWVVCNWFWIDSGPTMVQKFVQMAWAKRSHLAWRC